MRRTVVVTIAALGLAAACQDLTPRPSKSGGDSTSMTDPGSNTGTGNTNQNNTSATTSPTPSSGSNSSQFTRVSSPWATVSAAVIAGAGGAAGTGELPAASKVGFAATGSVAVFAGGLTATGLILGTFATASATTLTPWATASLPIPLCDMGMGIDSLGRFVMVGGVTQTINGGERTNSQSKEVFIGTPETSGKITWTKGVSLGVARTAMGFTSFKGRLYVVAGQPDPPPLDEVATNSVLVGTTDSAGSLTWTTAEPLPDATKSAAASSTLVFGPAVTVASAGGKDRIYVLGGLEATAATAEPRAKVWKAELDPATGMPGTWTSAQPMPEGRAYNQAYLNAAGQLVVVAGLGPGPQTKRGMLKATIKSDGDLDWQASAPELPLPLQDFGLIRSNGNVTIAGGTHIGFTEYSNEVLQLPLSN